MPRQQTRAGFERHRRRTELTLPDLTRDQLADLAERLELSWSKVVEQAVAEKWEALDPGDQ